MDVTAWLRNLGLEEYDRAFRENAIDAQVLPELTAEDLKDLGVVQIGHRRKLLTAIAALRATPASTATGSPPDGENGQPQIALQSAVPPAGWPEPSHAERRQLTVMFCDLVGSTELAARLDPEDYRVILSAYHQACAEAITRVEGFVAKYMGDGVLAYFGYPQAHEDEASRAVRAGLAVVAAVSRLPLPGATVPLQVRIGIATGLTVVGDLIGTGSAQEQAAAGETPNLAARLQALAPPGGVVIAPSTRRLIGNEFDLEDLGSQHLKGFIEPVQAWRVLGEQGVESRFEARASGLTPLVGREQETALLLARWKQARDGEGQVILLSGEPGIGKSRTTQALYEAIAADPHIRLRHQCSPHHVNSALYPTIEHLQRAAHFQRQDTPEVKLDKLETLLTQSDSPTEEATALIAALLSIPTDGRYPPLSLIPQRRKERTIKVLIEQVVGLARKQPVLIVFEDVHWADPTTLEMLDQLIGRIASEPVLLLLTFRPEFTWPRRGRPHVTLLSLNRLTKRQSTAMVEKVTGDKALPTEVLDQIVSRTDGVPLFVEELTKTLLESRFLEEEADRYVLTGPLPPLAIPSTLQDSLMARLDRLASVKELAQIGAAIGRDFSYGLVAAVSLLSESTLQDALAQLVDAELIFQKGTPPEAVYTFKHALVQDAAYASLLKSRRHQLHVRIAQVLEEQFAELAETQPELLAHHFTEAELGEPAVAYWLRAGERAAARSALSEAVAHLGRGLNALSLLSVGVERDRAELEFQIALGTHLMPLRGWTATAVEQAWARARELCDRTDDTERLLRVLWGQFTIQHVRSELDAALDNAGELLRRGEERGDLRAITRGHLSLGVTLAHLARFSQARWHLEETAKVGIRAGAAAFESHAFDPVIISRLYLARCLLHSGYPDQCREVMTRALLEAERSGHLSTIAYTWNLAAQLGFERRDLHDTRVALKRLIPLAREQGYVLWLAMAEALDSWVMAEEGKQAAECAKVRHALEEWKAIMRPFLLAVQAEMCARLGRPAEAIPVLDAGLALVGEKGEVLWEPELHRLKGDMSLATSTHTRPEAEACYTRAIAIARRQEARLAELRAATSLARLWRDQGHKQGAYELLAPVCDWFSEGFDTPDLQGAKYLLEALR